MNTELYAIASQFQLTGTVESIDILGEGFINDTFTIRTAGNDPDYILQRKNKNIFPDVPSMMDNIAKVTAHLRKKIQAEGGDPMRETLSVIPTNDGKLCYEAPDGEFWAVTVFIPDTLSYFVADSTILARKGGEGIGKFQAQLADFKEPLFDTIKGFHDIRHRFNQWDECLAKDLAGRKASLTEEISWIESRRQTMLDYWKLVEDGTIPRRVTHNDTKISNFLFDKESNLICVIDLDTVMSAPALNDYGDAIRSYANLSAEDEPDLSKIRLSLDMFKAYTEGYLKYMGKTLTKPELDYLAFSALYITYEQTLRFLMDYIDGDTYYRIKYPEHNLVRTHAQNKLLQEMEKHYDEMVSIVNEAIK